MTVLSVVDQLDYPAKTDRILQDNIGGLRACVLIGVDLEGQLVIQSTDPRAEGVLWAIESARHALLAGELPGYG